MSISMMVGGISSLLVKALDFFEGDDKRQVEIALKELENMQAQLMGQQAINQAEAGHRTVFVAGWRPFIGWVCGFALSFEFILRPVFNYIFMMYYPETPSIPSISEVLLELVFAMLGIGSLRSFEKYKGVAK